MIRIHNNIKSKNSQMSMNNNSSVVFDSLGTWVRELGLEEHLTNQEIESGRLVGQIMRKIVDGYNLELMNSNSAVNRVSNWNNLINELRNINIRVSQDDKTKIINGNKEIVYQVIFKLKQYQQQHQKQNEVDISKIDPLTTIADSSSLLELLILSIMKYFGLSSKESVALLSNDSRYLAHILAKGFKGEFKPITNLIKQLITHIQLLNQFCSRNKDNEQFLIRAIKPSIISKSDQVAILGLELLDRYLQKSHPDVSHSLHRFELLKQLLLSTLILGIKRHAHLSQYILNFIMKTADNSDNLLVILKNQLLGGNASIQKQHDYQNILLAIFQIMKEQRKAQKFLHFKGVKEALGRAINNIRNTTLTLSSISIVIELAKQNAKFLLQIPESSSLIQNLQQASATMPKQSEQFSYVVQLFTLLSILGTGKIHFAPAIYKILVSKYNETVNRLLLNTFIDNFNEIIREFPSIPYSLIVSTINSKLESNLLELNEKQLYFFQSIVEMEEAEDSVDEKSLLIIYNCVSKLFLEEPAYSDFCGQLIIDILRKYGQSIQIFSDLTNKFIKVCLAVHFANTKKLYMNSHKYRKSVSGSVPPLDSEDALMKLKNINIQSFLYKLIKEQLSSIVSSAEPLISYSLIQLENISKDHGSGLRKVLQLLGDPAQILQKYEIQAKKLDQENSKKQESINKRSKLKEANQWAANNHSRYSKSPNQPISSHISNSDEILATKKMSTGRYTNFQSQLGVTPAAQRGLDKYHKVYLSKIEKLEKEQAKKKEDEDRQQYLKRVFERKMLDKGIEVKKFKDEEYQYIWQFGEKEKEIKSDTVKGRVVFPYYLGDNQQERDIKGLEYTLKKYGKVLKVYYTQYSGHHRPKNLDSFDQIAQKYNLLYSASLVRMFREHTLDEFMTVKEIQQLIKTVNKTLNKQMDDPASLDYEAFEQFIIQSSFIMFTRPPKDMRGHPISQMVEETISRFRMYAGQNRLNQKMFEDPENVYINETEAVRELNRKLAENSEYILPEGYKKIVEKKVFFTHRIFLDAMTTSYKDVYEVIDQILEKAVGVHIIEPFTTYETNAKARPALYYNQRQDTDVYNEKMAVFMKKQVLKIPIKDREVAKQCALTLQEIVDAVELGHDRIGMKHENTYLKSKRMQFQTHQKRQEEEKKKWQERTRQIKSALVKHKQVQQEKVNEEKEKKKQQKRKEQEKERKRKEEEERLKKKVEQYQNKKKEDQERRRKQDRERKKKDKAEAQRKKKEAQETKKKIEQIKQQKQEEEATRKKEEDAEKKRRQEQQRKKFEQEQKRKKQMIEEYKNNKSGMQTSKLKE